MRTGVKILLGIIVLAVGALMSVLYYFYRDTEDPYVQACDYSVPAEVIPTFTDGVVNFEHKFDDTRSLPMMAAALLDIDNDGVDELYVGGGDDQQDALFKYSGGEFINVAMEVFEEIKNDASLGAASADMNNDGQQDLVVCRTSGVYLHLNNKGKFMQAKLSIPLNEKTTPISLSLGDINKDGWVDMFVAGYIKLDSLQGQTIFNDPTYGGTSLLLVNNGNNTFSDITISSGLNYVHNTFQGVLIDVDGDDWLDLVVAHDTGEVRTYKNNEGKTFDTMPNPLTGKFAYPMGIAAADYNNDGRVDFFFSNTGSSVPEFMARGDLRDDQTFVKDWILFGNEGDFKFSENAKQAKIADFEFSWGAIFQDFNLDGLQDLAVAENYIDFPPQKAFKLPCRLLIQLDSGHFAAVEEQAKAVNKNYAITPLSTDFNADGYPDLVYSNLNGPLKIFLSVTGRNNYLNVRFLKNAQTLGARVSIDTPEKTLTEYLYSGEGLCSDQSGMLTFGLGGDSTVISRVIVHYISGKTDTLHNIAPNSMIRIN